MKTSATETQLIDSYLLQQMPPAEKLVFDARLILCTELHETVALQHKVHQLVQLHGRKNLKAQIKAVEQEVFSQPAYSRFRQMVIKLFG